MSYTLGVDINNRYSQLSVYTQEDKNPVPVSAILGQDFYEIPTMVAYIESQNRWCYGLEALSLATAGGAVAVDNLLMRAMNDESVNINDEEYRVCDLLELYIKKLLGMANLIAPYQLAEKIVFSAELLNHESIAFLNSLVKNLSIDADKISLMSHSECIHYYMIHQNRELWSQDVLVLDYSSDVLLAKIYSVNKRTKPIVTTIAEYSYDIDVINDDERLLPVVEELLEGKIISSVYLIGENELEKNCPRAISKLCSKRRAFMGRNLYTRGACYASMRYAKLENISQEFLFLGRDKLKCNIGLYTMDESGKEVVSELVEAGNNWYDVSVNARFYLDSQREVRFVLIPIDGTDERNIVVRLTDFPKRPPHCTAISLSLTMSEPDVIKIEIKDLGFGEIFASSGCIFEEVLNIGE